MNLLENSTGVKNDESKFLRVKRKVLSCIEFQEGKEALFVIINGIRVKKNLKNVMKIEVFVNKR